jgi:hypothetical protein
LVGEVMHLVELRPAEGRALGAGLHLDQRAGAGHDEVAVRPGLAVLGIVEVENGLARIDPAGDGGDMVGDRVRGNIACLQELVHRQPQRDPTPGDRGAARAAIGLDHIAIHGDLTLAQSGTVDARPQGAPDKPLNFLRSPGLLARRSLAPHPRVGGAGQHAVFRRHPTQPGVLQEWRHAFLEARRAQHMRRPAFDQARALGMFRRTDLDGNVADFV